MTSGEIDRTGGAGQEPLRLREAAMDLLTGVSCLGCGRPGRLLCAWCAASLPATAWPARPDPTPPGLAPPWATATYAGLVRDLVVGHKERRRLALRAPLAGMLAAAVRAAAPGPAPVLLVPVPSRRAVVRERGHDPLAALTRRAAVQLRREGVVVHVAVRLLGGRHRVADQAGLDAAARRANLDGSMWCPGLRRLPPSAVGARLVVCDDVVTTGATLAEAQRALGAVGLPVTGHAAVAATPRRHAPASRLDAGPLAGRAGSDVDRPVTTGWPEGEQTESTDPLPRRPPVH